MVFYTKKERDLLVSKGELDDDVGYHYCLGDQELVEFNIDDHISFKGACDSLPYGGNLSVRKLKDTKPAILIGQDICVFKNN